MVVAADGGSGFAGVEYNYSEAFPLGSKGSKRAMKPETRNRAPAMKIGTLVVKFAYRAMIGAYTRQNISLTHNKTREIPTIIPNTRLALATIAFPVPLSFVGNNSGDRAYRTPYITLEVKL